MIIINYLALFDNYDSTCNTVRDYVLILLASINGMLWVTVGSQVLLALATNQIKFWHALSSEFLCWPNYIPSFPMH